MENFKFFCRTSHSHHVSWTIGSAAGFCSLRALRLVGVNIMGEVLENFLSNCPFLEQLGIVGTTYLVKLKIAGPSLKLKCLEISHCWHLENLEISAINLVSFTYWGKDIGNGGDSLIGLTSVIKASPNLSEFSVRFIRPDQSAYINAVKEATKCHHHCLKVVEFVGFDGSSNPEVDLVLHILEVAASLEKIIIDPRSLYHSPKLYRMEVARKHARQLKTRLPATVELVIL
ncbi:uncharacterized protein LOC132307888 [Cornus florida]|uniref:uncharacterized protein LOC132307888 n=1 Tax=Cornus florida TaxID=4283 RepID=UPI0028A1AD39|nr:uncharacterized protein LOC132307888 [Cornus florida]